jgi:CRP-like cAMP-binding protein
MDQKVVRDDLERRLAQSRRLSNLIADPTTTERLKLLILDLERQLQDAK